MKRISKPWRNSPLSHVHSIFPKTLSLTGFARIGEESVITLRDSESKKSHLVSGDINDEGWKLVEMSSDGDYGSENTFANIAIAGGEIVNLRFNAERLDYEHMRHRAGGKKQWATS